MANTPNIWLVEDYLRKALNHWDIDGKSWVQLALDEITSKKIEEKVNVVEQNIQDIFEFWNSYHVIKGWWSHRKINNDLHKAISEALKNYTCEDICEAISNYVIVLCGDKYFWSYVWSLQAFLTVKQGRQKDSPYKWYQFLPENFIKENYLINVSSKDKEVISVIEDPEPVLTKDILDMFRRLINNLNYSPLTIEVNNKFKLTTKKMSEYFGKKNIIKYNWIKYLEECLRHNYVDKGEVIYPGNLCSDIVWDVLIPQYMAELGCL
jgi:hypothetical protein